MKQYKAVNPNITIHNIKKILGEVGILTKEKYIDNDKFHSCRIDIGNSRIIPLKIGTNGKGATFEYSLASGYAEFMERLQNNMLIFAKRFAVKDFIENEKPSSNYISKLKDENLFFNNYYDKNEIFLSISELVENWGEELRLLYNFDSIKELSDFLYKKFDNKKIICIPFYSVFNKSIVYAPVELFLSATGSNGMAAGNIPIEAILQSICELFERYAISSIHNQELTPPSIPIDFFKGKPIYEKLEYLTTKTKYRLIIKDCSLGKGLPVIGVIIIDPVKQRYNFKLASDFIPEIALERCLNELYQGVKYFKSVPFKLYTLSDISKLNGENSLHINLERIFVNGSGFWPMAIFSKDYSYDFSPYPKDLGESNEYDLLYGLDIIKQLKFNVYVRDNSILGFPTYYIVIPGMSQIVSDRKADTIDNYHDRIKAIRNLGNIDKLMAESLSSLIHENYNLIKLRGKDYTKNYIYNIDPDLLDLDIELLEFMLFFYLYDFERALSYLSLFLADKPTHIYQYYYAIYDFVDMHYLKKTDTALIREILKRKYNEELCSELFSDFSNPKNIFQYYKFPKGFDFSEEEFRETCALFSVLRIERAIEEYAKQYNIEQDNLREIFK